MRWIAVAALSAWGGLSTGCGPAQAAVGTTPEVALLGASATVAGRCAGVVVAGERHLLTAAHCVRPGEEALPVVFADGSSDVALVETVDRATDLAVLSLQSGAPEPGLQVALGLPEVGTRAYFAGRIDRGAPVQEVEIVRVAPCPSLPDVPAALFTSLRGHPGDSGAPVVDDGLQVLGLVHGGARCSIATPAHPAAAMLPQ